MLSDAEPPSPVTIARGTPSRQGDARAELARVALAGADSVKRPGARMVPRAARMAVAR
jgi:hypothetical protein